MERPSHQTDHQLGPQLRTYLAKYPGLKLAILFGSLADDEGRVDSDLDLAVLESRSLSAEKIRLMTSDLAEKFGRPVDLIDLSVVGEPLLGQILGGERLIGSDEEFARVLSRHLIDAADFLPLHERILAERRTRWIG